MNNTEFEHMLNEPLAFNDLIKNGTHFEINSNFDNLYEEEFNLNNSDDESNMDKDIQDVIKTPWNKSFDTLREHMTKFDDFIYKKITQVGNGEVIPEKARVKINYNGFWENNEQPFDSTYLRAKPLVFVTGNEEILSGLERATKTMTKGEEAQFLISWKELFGPMGCPPRIKAKADALFIIQLLNFDNIGDNMALEKLSETEKKSFTSILESIQKIRLNGVDLCKQKKNHAATVSFHKAIKILENFNLVDEAEQSVQQELLIKLYTNLTVCYNSLNLPLKTFCMCNELRRISNTAFQKNAKALYHEGKAFVMINDYVRARKQLNLARNLIPHSKEIINELEKLNDLYQKHFKEECQMSRRAIGIMALSDLTLKKKEDEKVDENFQKEFLSCLKTFQNNNKKIRLDLPLGLNTEEVNWIRSAVEDLKITVQNPEPLKNNTYTLVKNTN